MLLFINKEQRILTPQPSTGLAEIHQHISLTHPCPHSTITHTVHTHSPLANSGTEGLDQERGSKRKGKQENEREREINMPKPVRAFVLELIRKPQTL